MSVREVPFSELLTEVVDNRGKTCPTASEGIPLIATNCVHNDLLYPAKIDVRYVDENTYRTWFRGHPEPADILFVNKGTPGRVCMVPDPVDFCIAQDMVALRADPQRVYPRYLFAVLRSKVVQARIANMHVGTLIPHFKKGDFDKLLIPVPERSMQEQIGDIYMELSLKIDLNRRMNATLAEMGRAIFSQWLHSLKGRVKVVRVQELIDAHVLAVGDGYRAKRSELADSGLPFARAGNLDGEFLLEDAEVLGEDGVRAAGEKVSKPYDVVFTSKGTVGRMAMVGPSNPRFVFAPQLCYWRVLQPAELSPHILYGWMESEEFRRQLDSVKGQTDMADYASLRDQRQMRMTLPSPEQQTKINSTLEALHEKRFANAAESRTLAALRDSLLPRLLSREVRRGMMLIEKKERK